MLSCWHDLLFLFISFCFIFFFLPWVGCVGVGVFGLIVFSLSPSLAERTPIDDNNILKIVEIHM